MHTEAYCSLSPVLTTQLAFAALAGDDPVQI